MEINVVINNITVKRIITNRRQVKIMAIFVKILNRTVITVVIQNVGNTTFYRNTFLISRIFAVLVTIGRTANNVNHMISRIVT